MRTPFALAVAAASLAGCAAVPAGTPTVPPHERELQEGRPGLFGDLRWTVDPTGKREPVGGSEEADFKRWKESAPTDAERREFEEWRAWQEWKRKNPK
jgi:hypothetical protein